MPAAIRTDSLFRDERRAAIGNHRSQIGIDYVAVEKDPAVPSQWLLHLHFVPSSVAGKSTIPEQPEQIPRANIRITTGTGAPGTNMQVVGFPTTDPGAANVLTITVQFEPGAGQAASTFATYTLELLGITNLDPFFAQVSFSLQADLPGDLDPRPRPLPPPAQPDEPSIDYLARDYASFRQLMLNRLDLLMPQWKERHVADLGVALVEILAYAADHLSYYQDAVATEAYLGTARRRVSVRRHARLVDYAMQEGCNARVWVQVQVAGDQDVMLPSGTKLLSRSGYGPTLSPAALEQAIATGAQAFETMHATVLRRVHNEMHFYTWGARECVLPQGTTRATLRDQGLSLQPGDVLIFEQVRSPLTGSMTDAGSAYRHAVRLTRAVPGKDPLGGQLLDPRSEEEVPIIEIEWEAADALPFPLPIAANIGVYVEDVSVVRGNIVLADHGRTVEEDLPEVPPSGRYRPQLRFRDLTYSVPYDVARALPASAITQNPRAAIPRLVLYERGQKPAQLGVQSPSAGGSERAAPLQPPGATWLARRDLLSSDRFAREFVVEMENDGRATLRFGDGVRGMRPAGGTRLRARYRVGNGPSGNIGAESIAHLVTDDPEIATQILCVRDPLAAQGGSEPESIEQVRLAAPAAFRIQERCVTAEDYAAAAMRHPEVRQAGAVLRWTGSWYTAFVSVIRRGGQPVDDSFQTELLAFMERFRQAGFDLEIRAPRYVPLDIALPVAVASESFRTTVRQALRETFSAADLPGGRRGFFHPDNFGFGQPVYLSQVVTATMQVPGVVRVDIETIDRRRPRFKRWGQPEQGELHEGRVAVGPLEIVRLDNDAAAPENGTIEFLLEGGR